MQTGPSLKVLENFIVSERVCNSELLSPSVGSLDTVTCKHILVLNVLQQGAGLPANKSRSSPSGLLTA
jgi:hypothetical protein